MHGCSLNFPDKSDMTQGANGNITWMQDYIHLYIYVCVRACVCVLLISLWKTYERIFMKFQDRSDMTLWTSVCGGVGVGVGWGWGVGWGGLFSWCGWGGQLHCFTLLKLGAVEVCSLGVFLVTKIVLLSDFHCPLSIGCCKYPPWPHHFPDSFA